MRIGSTFIVVVFVIAARLGAQTTQPDSQPTDSAASRATTQPASAATSQPANRLAASKSPYLRQHAANPVAWWEWGDAAFAEAKRRGCLIFVSIGYSACHWCHVMEKESFDDATTARLMNDSFVNIKVDREERPDVDAMLQTYIGVYARGGGGGWPGSVWLTPDLLPVYGGTYFPNTDRFQLPSFTKVCEKVASTWRDEEASVRSGGSRIVTMIGEALTVAPAKDSPGVDVIERAARTFLAAEDHEHGGFGPAPKFPRTSVNELLLLDAARTPAHAESRAAALRGLHAIIRGGIADHVGGGFHRYSVDAEWLVPHFEKMLYDQAMIGCSLAEALRGSPEDLELADALEGVVALLVRELSTADGRAFVSSFDADSAAGEGEFYVWSPDEIERLLTKDELAIVRARFDWTEASRSDAHPGKHVLRVAASWDEVAKAQAIDRNAARARWAGARTKLAAARKLRPAPPCDDKVVVEWNAMAIGLLVRYARTPSTEEAAARRAIDRATAVATFLWTTLRRADGRLWRRWAGGEAAHEGALADYAWFARASLDLFEATGEVVWLERASALAATMRTRFEDAAGGFFGSAADAKDIALRVKDFYDGAYPSANAIAIEVLARLAALTESPALRESTVRALRAGAAELERAGDEGLVSFPALIATIPLVVEPPVEIVVIGDATKASTRALRQAALAAAPTRAIVVFADDAHARAAEKLAPSMLGKTSANGEGRAYVCRGATCSEPIESAAALRALLEPK